MGPNPRPFLENFYTSALEGFPHENMIKETAKTTVLFKRVPILKRGFYKADVVFKSQLR